MKISDTGLAIVMAFEGCLKPVPTKPGFFKPYVCPAGVLTIGWGTTHHGGHKIDAGTVWSQQQCDDALRSDMVRFENHVETLTTVPLAQHEYDALVSWAYNTGGPVSAGLWRALNAGRKRDVPAELAKWNKGGGKVLAGLVRRRKAEGLLFGGRIDEALQVAGVRRPLAPLSREPAVMVPQRPSPPDLEPAASATTRTGWLTSLLTLLQKAPRP